MHEQLVGVLDKHKTLFSHFIYRKQQQQFPIHYYACIQKKTHWQYFKFKNFIYMSTIGRKLRRKKNNRKMCSK